MCIQTNAATRLGGLRISALAPLVILFALVLGVLQTTRAEPPANMVLLNGKIITVDSQDTIVQAVAVTAGLITAVGTDSQIRPYIGAGTRVIDLKGKTVTPGLIDAHTHLAYYGQGELYFVNLRPPEVTSIPDIVRLIDERVKITPANEWVIGDGFSELEEKRLPTKHDIDPVSPNNPVLLSSIGGHFGTANQAALDLAKITRDTSDPVGGLIEREANGEPTGVLWNHPAMDLVRQHYPQFTSGQMKDYVIFAQDRYIAEGITSFQDVNSRTVPRMQGYKLAEPLLKLRGLLHFTIEKQEDVTPARALVSYVDPMLVYDGACKFLLDGQPPTAYTYDPHPGPSYTTPTWNPAVLKSVVKDLNREGRQLSFHVMGDAAIDLALDAIEEALADTPRTNHRHRLEHCIIPTAEAIARIKRLGVVVVMQPAAVYVSGDQHIYYWGAERVLRLIPLRTMLDTGVRVALSSDFPTVPELSPQLALWGAAARTSDSGKPVAPLEAISIPEGLRAHTMGAAYAGFEEDIKGSIEVGKMADLTVWSGDLYTVPLDQVKDLRAIMTIVGGNVVCQLGDVTGDGGSDVADLAKMSRLLSGLDTPTDAQKITGDMNADRTLDIADWIAALRAAAGL